MKAASEKNKTAPWHDYLDNSNNRTRVQNPQNINRTGPNKKRIKVQKPKKFNRGGAIIWNSRVGHNLHRNFGDSNMEIEGEKKACETC